MTNRNLLEGIISFKFKPSSNNDHLNWLDSTILKLKREQIILKLTKGKFDLLVIGGGITGAGIALDAVTRGLTVALIDQQDFAAGTSSRSTKLIHGGLRYLKQGDIALVREVGRERAILHKNAPHLVMPEKMLMPLMIGGQFGKLLTSIGLSIYDWLANIKKTERRILLNVTETSIREPLLDRSKLKGGALFYEYRTDDARLTIEVLKTATQNGAACLNYIKANQFIYDNNKITGVNAVDKITGEQIQINANHVVNATGAWVDELRKTDKSLVGKKLHLTKGIHLVLPYEKFPVKQSIYFDVPDGRMIFAIPRDKITYFGTTDTNYLEHPDTEPRVTIKDAEYLINAINQTFPMLNIKMDDIISSWAGLRPLIHQEGKSASELSRKDEIFISKTGLISIAGGKLSGYRKMAERVVNRFCSKPCVTKKLPIFQTVNSDLSYSIDHEWVEYLSDYAVRRTGMLYFEPEKLKSAMEELLDCLAERKKWSTTRKEEESRNLKQIINNTVNFI